MKNFVPAWIVLAVLSGSMNAVAADQNAACEARVSAELKRAGMGTFNQPAPGFNKVDQKLDSKAVWQEVLQLNREIESAKSRLPDGETRETPKSTVLAKKLATLMKKTGFGHNAGLLSKSGHHFDHVYSFEQAGSEDQSSSEVSLARVYTQGDRIKGVLISPAPAGLHGYNSGNGSSILIRLNESCQIDRITHDQKNDGSYSVSPKLCKALPRLKPLLAAASKGRREDQAAGCKRQGGKYSLSQSLCVCANGKKFDAGKAEIDSTCCLVRAGVTVNG